MSVENKGVSQNPLISIIVPVYNAEGYLHNCVKSIISQKYSNWELILVEDGSPDKSGELCDDWCTKDNRIRSFHKENGGASSARNLGIDQAYGEWICFVDSDDYVGPNYLSNLLSGIGDHVDVVYANYDSYSRIPSSAVLDLEYAVGFMINNGIFSMSGPVAKLFNIKLFRNNNVDFPVGIHMGEDSIFNIKILNVANRISFITSNDYTYNHTQGSLSARYYSFDSEYNAYKLWKQEQFELFSKYFSAEDALKKTWEIRIKDQFNRVLQSVYRFTPHYSFIEQVRYLNLIDRNDIDEYNTYYHPILWRRKLNKFLIVNRMFLTYSLIGVLDYFFYKK